MHITDIKTFLIAGRGHNVILVKVETDDGLYGLGEGSLAGRDQGVLGVIQHLKPLLIGCDPARIEDVWQECYRNTFWRGGPILLSAISGIDIALWDLKGKRLGVPIYDLLGGKTRDRVRVYTHLSGSTDDELCEQALGKIEQGYSALLAEIFPVHPVVRDGYYDIPTLPGLGLEFNEEAVVRYDASDRIPELPHLRRADGSVTDW